MGNMQKRIAALEIRAAPRAARWHRVIVDGHSKADALAAHEARHGIVGSDGVIYRVIVAPIRTEGSIQ